MGWKSPWKTIIWEDICTFLLFPSIEESQIQVYYKALYIYVHINLPPVETARFKWKVGTLGGVP